MPLEDSKSGRLNRHAPPFMRGVVRDKSDRKAVFSVHMIGDKDVNEQFMSDLWHAVQVLSHAHFTTTDYIRKDNVMIVTSEQQ